MKRLFLDTEFSSLTIDAKLISIALVSENGDEFYAELNDTYKHSDLSDFSVEYVIPLLRGKSCEMSFEELKVALKTWIEKQGTVSIVTDSLRWDWRWIIALLKDNWPSNLAIDPCILSMNYLQNFDKFEEILMYEFKRLPRHNALNDAIANCRAWKQSGGDTWSDHWN
jgi:hypothetical protein